MKQILIDRYGTPADVARCAEVPDLGAPGPGQVLFDVLAFPINPADMGFCRGTYRLRPPLPTTPGAECVGVVRAVGAGVTGVAVGDRVINLQRENWAQQRLVAASDVVVIPPGIDTLQSAMLRINPPTAQLLLTDITKLAPGDWVIQNVANSSVGRHVVRLAKPLGLKVLNVVRRESSFAALQALGADACVVDGADLPQRAAAATGGAPIRLALEAVGGEATARLADCVADEGWLCSYGSMTGEGPVMPRGALVYRGLNVTGFMLGRGLAKRSAPQVRELYAGLAAQMKTGALDVPIRATYPIERIGDALRHADEGAREGKILVLPNGAV